MACPLRNILNPVHESSHHPTTQDTQGASNAETLAESSSSEASHSGPSISTTGKHLTVKNGAWEDLALSPREGTFNDGRAKAPPYQLHPILSPLPAAIETWLDQQAVPQLQKTERPRGVFNMLLNWPELIFEVSKQLDIEDLVSLYAISKEFHLLFNRHYTAFILGQSVSKAADSSRTFTFRSYRKLCIRDPARRLLEISPGGVRWVPSFRWLRMILYREAVVADIVKSLFYEGHRLPGRTSHAIKKLWFTLDICDNARRIALFHSVKFWTSRDLFLAQMFIVKLDMRLTCPISGNGEIELRRMLLNQRSLTTLARVLRREELLTQLDLLRLIVRYSYMPPRPPQNPILGIPACHVGRLQYEGWGSGKRKFVPVDHLLAAESVRRNENWSNMYIDMMVYGYIRKEGEVWQDIMTPENAEEDDGAYDRYLHEAEDEGACSDEDSRFELGNADFENIGEFVEGEEEDGAEYEGWSE